MIEILYLIFILLISLALGEKILKLIGIKFEFYLENMIFSLPLGLSILAYVTFFFGVIGLLYKSVISLILFVIFIFLIRDIKNIILNLLNFIKKSNLKKLMNKYRLGFNFFTILILFILIFTLLNFVISFSPPWHFDVLTYHLAIQKLYINAHKIFYMPYLFYSNLPQVIDTIYLVGFISYNAILSHLLAYALGIVALLAIFSFCKRFFNYKIAILASLIFFSSPMVTEGMSIAHIDVQFALFVFLSIYALISYFSTKDRQWLILSSIFAGLSISSKIFGVVAAFGVFSLLLAYLFIELKKRELNYNNVLFTILIFSLIAFLITMPWLLKSYFYTGNPVWPLFNEVFNGRYWDKEHTENLAKRELVRELSITNYLRLPWDIHTQTGKDKDNILEFEGIGPFFLVFIPIYFFLNKRNWILNLFFMLIIAYISIWFFVTQEFRHIIFVLPLIAIISAYVIFELLKIKHLSKALMVLLLFTFSFNILVWFGGNLKELPVALGLESVDSFYSKYPGSIYEASKFINNNLPDNSKILLFRDTRGYFLDRDYIWGDPLLQTYIDYSKFKNEDDFYKELKDLGLTHILVNNEFEYEGFIVNEYRYNKRILGMMDKLLKKHTKNIYDKDGVAVNEII